MEKFTSENFNKGFLIDEELMAGISESPEQTGSYHAFVVRHTTGETLGSQRFDNLFEAIRTLNEVDRPWVFESISRCGSGSCGNGKCGTGSCGNRS